MNPVVVIPTYVKDTSAQGDTGILQTFDHATSLGNKGELPRCLRSLEGVQGIGQIIVIVACEERITYEAERQVHRICHENKALHTAVFGINEVELIQRRLEQLGFGTLYDEIGTGSYGAIRNYGLALACVLGFDSVVFIDDDEVIEDPDFLAKAVYGLGKMTRSGVPILAKSGYYINSQGSYLASAKDKFSDKKWPKRKLFNAWISQAITGKRLSRSNHSCGGCLALTQDAYMRVAFDPYISRGEDLDYLLNLRMYGSDMWFDNQWNLKHLPPKTTNEGRRFRQDVYRWIYEYRKLEFSRTQIDLLQLKPSSLEPYPGPFLSEDIFKRVKSTARARMLTCSDKQSYAQALKCANTDADEYATNQCSKYFTFQFTWADAMQGLKDDAVLRTALVQSVSKQSIEACNGEEMVASGTAGSAAAGAGAGAGAGQSRTRISATDAKIQRRRRAREGRDSVSAASWGSAAELAARAQAAQEAANAAINNAQAGAAPTEQESKQATVSFEQSERALDPGLTSEIRLNIAD